MRAIVIAGTHSGCGKTTVTLGIIAAFKKKGLKVQPFKTGPDFIDAGLHRLIAGRPSRNLDLWMCGQEAVVDCFHRYAVDADIAVVEGVMGMYDGHVSTASLSHFLHVPIILVVDAYGMAESAGALVKGYTEYRNRNAAPGTKMPGERGAKIIGVIFNRVSSEAHFTMLKNSVDDVTVLGYLPRDLHFEIPDRHLGLVVAEEHPLIAENIDKLAGAVLDHIDVDLIVQSAGSVLQDASSLGILNSERKTQDVEKFTIAVAYDKAFCFYYEDNLDALKNAGAEIVRFSPLSDPEIPGNADAVYIGGGYPEIYADKLSGNTAMLSSVSEWARSGRPLYAECGGLMYLSQGIHDFNGNFFRMAGVFPFATAMKNRPRLGYREIRLKEDCILGKKGETCRGHEFHYSDIQSETSNGEEGLRRTIYAVSDHQGEAVRNEGFRFKNTLASYIHLHFSSNRHIADTVAAFIKEEQKMNIKET